MPIWAGFLVCGVVLAIVYVALPYGRLASGIYIAATALPAVVIAGATCYGYRPFASLGWRCLAAGVGLTATGHALWYWFDLRGIAPFPSVADVAYLAAYPLYAVALWLFGGSRPRGDGVFIDGLIVSVSAGVVVWVLIIAPYLHSPALTMLQLVVSAAYPVADLILLALVLRLVFLHRTRHRAHQFIMVGMTCVLAADMLYAHGENAGWYAPGGLIDGLWVVAVALFAAAAWHPAAAIEPRSYSSTADLSNRRLLILTAAALHVPLLSLVIEYPTVDIDGVAAIGAIVIFSLIMVRMAGLLKRSQRQADELERLATTDPLTGAHNRRYLEHQLHREMARAERTKAPLHIAFFDLDHFKHYNDSLGHAAGDALLKALVDNWGQDMRPTDILARLGGEEFVVVLPDTRSDDAWRLVERLRSRVPFGQSCSAGLARFESGEMMDRLLARADQALYAAKARGRDQVVMADAHTAGGGSP